MEKLNLIHIASEIVIIIALTVYFYSQNKKLAFQSEMLSKKVAEQEIIIKKHDEIISRLIELISIKNIMEPIPSTNVHLNESPPSNFGRGSVPAELGTPEHQPTQQIHYQHPPQPRPTHPHPIPQSQSQLHPPPTRSYPIPQSNQPRPPQPHLFNTQPPGMPMMPQIILTRVSMPEKVSLGEPSSVMEIITEEENEKSEEDIDAELAEELLELEKEKTVSPTSTPVVD